MNELTLSSRHRIRNSSPGGLRPRTLLLGHGGSPQYWVLHFCFFQTAKTGNRTPNSTLKGSGANHYPRAPAQEPRRQVKIYLQRVVLPPPSPVLANIHSKLAYDVPRTENAGLPTKFLLMLGRRRSTLLVQYGQSSRHWPDTNPSLGLPCTLRKHVAFTQCCFNVDQQSFTLARIKTALGDCTCFVTAACRWLYRWRFLSRRQKHQITRYIDPMLI